MQTFVAPLFHSGKVKLTQTSRPVTPFGGLVSFIAFLGQIGYARQLEAHLPWQLTSPNAIPLGHTLTAFLLGVVVGARRFAHTEMARADRALHALLGLARWPGADTVRSLFHRFTQPSIQSFWRPLWIWLLGLLRCPKAGFSLDLDSTVFQRSGSQQGAARGYNPRRPGRNSQHPLLAVLAEVPFVLHGWLRSGNTGAARGVVPFLREALALLSAGMSIRCVRADSGFFEEALLAFLEERALSYVVVARLTTQLKRRAASIQNWTAVDEHYAVGEFTAKLMGWSRERRFVVVRERVREDKAAVGRKLIEVPGYTFRVWVTNRPDGALELWRDYNHRACVEQRIEELKNDLGAQGFCTQNFWATEAAFLAVLFTFNLLSLYQQQASPQQGYRQPATLRAAVFVCGAILGRSGRQVVLHLSASWGGLAKHKPLLEAVLDWRKSTAPKLVPPEDQAACAPCRI
ncbi:MAG TPA: IS1380 family transposase [Candidatus Dormibacteraeota bacterium]|nr:IS1380 family transposase [Candidatus Dormibacteraeota bacterium]